MFVPVLKYGVIGRAMEAGLIQFRSLDPRHFTTDQYQKVDDRPYGGGPGMVMMYEPVQAAISQAKQRQPTTKVIYLSPQGKRLEQADVNELAKRHGMILIAGRYEGIDERVMSSVDEEWSVGDYVLTGGELPAMILIDSVCRMLPGVLGDKNSANEDSFVDGLLDYPHYTRPEQVADYAVPKVLLSGDHAQIRRWRLKQALGKTWQARPDLLACIELDDEQKKLLQEFIIETQSS